MRTARFCGERPRAASTAASGSIQSACSTLGAHLQATFGHLGGERAQLADRAMRLEARGEGAGPGDAVDQALLLDDLDRLSCGHPADSELGSQFALAGQGLSGGGLARLPTEGIS